MALTENWTEEAEGVSVLLSPASIRKAAKTEAGRLLSRFAERPRDTRVTFPLH